MQRRRDHHIAQRLQRGRQIDRLVVAQTADDFAHIDEQLLRDSFALLDVLLRFAAGEMAGHFEIEAERGQMMADEVVKIAGDAEALRGAAADLEQLRGHPQLRIRLGQRLPRFHLRVRHMHREEREDREGEIDQRVDDARTAVVRHDESENDRVDGDAADGIARRIRAELRGDDHEQHRQEAGRLQMTQVNAASVSKTSIVMRIELPQPGRVPTTKPMMKTMNAPKSSAARAVKSERYSASHSTVGIPTMIHVRIPTSFILCSFMFMAF